MMRVRNDMSYIIPKIIFLILGIIATIWLVHAFFYDPVNAGKPINGAIGMSMIIGTMFTGLPILLFFVDSNDEYPFGVVFVIGFIIIIVGVAIAGS